MQNITTSTTRRIARLASIGAGTGLLILAAASPAMADPAGNNGTIKVDDVEFDSHPNNEPHVGCVFEIDFYGFDESPEYFADVTFEAQAPTKGGVLLTDSVFIGEDDNTGAATPAGLDAHVQYDLTAALAGIEPQAQQGHHVKLTIEADGSQGAETKHKVFWVEGCTPPSDEPPADEPPADEPPSIVDEPPVQEPPAEEPPAVEPPAAEPPSVLADPPVQPDAPEVLGTTITAAPESLPRTGTGTVVMVAAGGLLVALGLMSKLLGVRLASR
jgi:hypothetical protein